MAEAAFRDKVSLAAAAAMADCLARQGGHFRLRDFQDALGGDYESLPLKGRIAAITQALTVAQRPALGL